MLWVPSFKVFRESYICFLPPSSRGHRGLVNHSVLVALARYRAILLDPTVANCFWLGVGCGTAPQNFLIVSADDGLDIWQASITHFDG